MMYPLRNAEGKMVLNKHHFGIKKRKYLFALLDFVNGFSADDSAKRVSALCGEKITTSMLKETFRPNLFNEILAFPGTADRISFVEFCSVNQVEHLLPKRSERQFDPAGWQERTMILFYLREVFDLRPPIVVVSETEYGS